MIGLYVDPASHAIGETFRLLKDFLEHEVGIAALLYLAQVDVNRLYTEFLLLAENADHVEFLAAPYDGNVAVLQVDHLVGVLHDGAGIRTQEELVVADAHHQGTLFAGSYNLVGVTTVEDGYGIGTDDLIEGYLNGLQQRQLLALHDILYQLDEHLGIGV